MTSAVPNVITVARLVIVPVVIVLLWIDAGAEGVLRWWAVALYLVAAISDFFDGYLARRWGVVSPFGKLADPIADKALVLGTLAALVVIDGIPWWPVAIIAIREVWVTVGRLLVARDTVIAASPGGKLKTATQLIAIFLYLVPGVPAWVDVAAWWTLLAATAIAVATGIDYTMKIAAAARRGRAGGDGQA